MKQVFGKPFVCLDSFVDVDKLHNIVEDINYGIALSHAYIKTNFASTHQRTETTKTKPKDFGSAYRCWLNDTDPLRQQRGQELLSTDTIAFEYWLEYEYKVIETLNYIVLRDYVKDYSESYVPLDALKYSDDVIEWTTVAKYFPTLKAWIDALPLKKIGAVAILLKSAGGPMPLHRDLFFNTDQYDHQEHFIWVDPTHSRPLYILDTDTDIKHSLINGTAFYWNNHDWHGGTKSVDALSWTIRIEGIFTDELIKELSK